MSAEHYNNVRLNVEQRHRLRHAKGSENPCQAWFVLFNYWLFQSNHNPLGGNLVTGISQGVRERLKGSERKTQRKTDCETPQIKNT